MMPRLFVFALAGFITSACGGQTPAPIKPSIDPGRMPGPLEPFGATFQFLDSAIAAGAAPGAVLGIYSGRSLYLHGSGRLGLDDPAVPDPTSTVYDLASLTKVIGLTTALMLAVDQSLIDLDAPVQRYVPAFTGPGKEQVTIRHLLVHASGLPAWRPLYQETNSRAEALILADTTPLEAVPGSRYVYSDLGAIVLTQAVESVFHQRLDSLLEEKVFGPLALSSTRFLPPAEWRARIAPTENDPWRGRILRGEVHDENAARLEGVSGHAGLFSTATDLLTFGMWLLGLRTEPEDAGIRINPAVSLHSRTAKLFLARQGIPSGSSRALGWDTPSQGSSAGSRLDSTSFGHTGFTGTSIWIDPTRELVIVLLTNRVHPTRENNRMGAVRRGVADRVVEEIDKFNSVRGQ